MAGCYASLIVTLVFTVFALVLVSFALATDFWFYADQVYEAKPTTAGYTQYCQVPNTPGCTVADAANNYENCNAADCKSLKDSLRDYRLAFTWGTNNFCHFEGFKKDASYNTDDDKWDCSPWRQITSPRSQDTVLPRVGLSFTSANPSTGTINNSPTYAVNSHYCYEATINTKSWEIISIAFLLISMVVVSILLCCPVPVEVVGILSNLPWFLMMLALILQIVGPCLMSGMCKDFKDMVYDKEQTVPAGVRNGFGGITTEGGTVGSGNTNTPYYWEESPTDATPSYNFDVKPSASYLTACVGAGCTFIALVSFLVWFCQLTHTHTMLPIVQSVEMHNPHIGPKWPHGPQGPRGPGFGRSDPMHNSHMNVYNF